MAGQFDADLDQMLGEYRDQLARAAETTRRLQELRATAVSQRRQVSATVGAQGELLELEFLTDGWREMAPRELAALIVGTVAQARQDVLGQVTEIVAPTLPPGIDAGALLSGQLGPADVLGDEPSTAHLAQHYRRPVRRSGTERPS